jgi:hypothetical protein
LESDGKKSLPAFSSTKKLEAFSATMSKELNKVFWLGYFEVLLADIAENVDVDVVILNAFSSKSWEIAIGSH